MKYIKEYIDWDKFDEEEIEPNVDYFFIMNDNTSNNYLCCFLPDDEFIVYGINSILTHKGFVFKSPINNGEYIMGIRDRDGIKRMVLTNRILDEIGISDKVIKIGIDISISDFHKNYDKYIMDVDRLKTKYPLFGYK